MAIIEGLGEQFYDDSYLCYNSATDEYLTIEYLGSGDASQRTRHQFSWVERPAITTWISFKGEEADRLTDFISIEMISKNVMFIPFKFRRIKGRVNTILVDHVLGVAFKVADLDDIGGLYV